MLEFKKIEIEDAESYRSLLQQRDEFSSENAFVNLFVLSNQAVAKKKLSAFR